MKKSKFIISLFLVSSLLSSYCLINENTYASTIKISLPKDGITITTPENIIKITSQGANENTTNATIEEPIINTTEEQTTTASAQTANLGLSYEPQFLDASRATDLYSSKVLQNTMCALTRPVFNGGSSEVTAQDGAEEITVSEDGLVWTFKLRDMKWSDGVPVRAQDYVYSILRTLDPNTASQYAFLLYPIKGAREYNESSPENAEINKENVGVVAKDDKTLEITLGSTCAYFIQTTYTKVFTPQRQDFVEKHGFDYGRDADKFLSCGPYTISEWKHNDEIVLKKNYDYWDEKNYPLEVVNLKIYSVINEEYTAFLAGKIDEINTVRDEDFEGIFNADPKIENNQVDIPSISYFLFNENKTTNSVMKNLKLRQAFSAAIDREEVINELYGTGLGKAAYNWIGDSFNLYPDLNYRSLAGMYPINTLKEKVGDPKATLIEGMEELGLGNDPSKLTLNYYMPSTSKELAEHFKGQLEETLGCNINVNLSDWFQYIESVYAYEHDIAAQSWTADYNDPMTMLDMFRTGTEQSGTGMANAKYDALIMEANSLPVENNMDRIKLLAEAENILLIDECAVAPWAHRQNNEFKYTYLKNYQPSVFGALNLRGVYIDKSK